MGGKIHFYSKKEEVLNVVTHAFGIALSVLGLILLIQKSIHHSNPTYFASAVVFGLSLLLLYTASTVYHSASKKRWRYRLNILDHSAIYILIAGTYTPFSLITLSGTSGWIYFSFKLRQVKHFLRKSILLH